MAKPLDYELSFAGVPFLSDLSESAAHKLRRAGGPIESYAPRQRPVLDLIDEIDKKFPFYYSNEFKHVSQYPGKNIGALAMQDQTNNPSDEVHIGDWYYPTSAVKWSVFRGLMTSSMVKAVLSETLGYKAKSFKMQASPSSPGAGDALLYALQSNMYMLPPRPLAEHGGDFDGLFIVTLVDERYLFQSSPVTLKITQGTTWDNLISTLATALGISVSYSAIDSVYSVPESDSQLWSCSENAAFLLDAVAYNIGRVVVRNLNGTYSLLTADESAALTLANRGSGDSVVRLNGGDMFYAGNKLPSGDLTKWRNSVVPTIVRVSFPKYVQGDDPVPHFLNTRYGASRPTSWYEDSFGETYNVDVPIASGGASVSGLIGLSNAVIHDTAKALYATEALSSGDPTNVSDLTSLALKVVNDYYAWQGKDGLDESYVGTFNWAIEGFHDVIWTYSERQGGARTRVSRQEWNQNIRELQHGTPLQSGYSYTIKGMGGHSVAQTWQDSVSGGILTTLAADLASGQYSGQLTSIVGLPTNNRWKADINGEMVLFEGTSGGNVVGVVHRGIDGTIQTAHLAGDAVLKSGPNTTYGVNFPRFDRMFQVYPSHATSGGIQGVFVTIAPGSITQDLLASGVGASGGSSTDCCACASGIFTTCVSGYPNPLPSGNYNYPDPVGGGTIWPYPLPSGVYTTIGSGNFPYPIRSGAYTILGSGGYPFPLQSGSYVFVPGYPYPMRSGLYSVLGSGSYPYLLPGDDYWIFVSGYPYPLQSNVYNIVSGYPYPLTSNTRVVVSGCFPYPICSNVYNLTSNYPYPLRSNVYITLTSSRWPYPLPSGTYVDPGDPTTGGGSIDWPYPLQSNVYVTTSNYPYPLKSGPYVTVSGPWPYPLQSNVYTTVSNYPYPLISGPYVTITGWPVPVKSGYTLNSGPTPLPSGYLYLASGAISSGMVGSGTISPYDIASGYTFVASGSVGSGAIQSGSLASGMFASGFIAGLLANAGGFKEIWSVLGVNLTTSIPAAQSEYPTTAVGSIRLRADLSQFTQAQLNVRTYVSGIVGSIMFAQFSANESSWFDLAASPTSGYVPIDNMSTARTTWYTIASGGTADVYLRLVTMSGDAGITTPELGLITLFAR